MQTSQRPSLIIAVQEVSPLYREELFEILSQLDRRRLAPRNLLVAPCLHGQHRVTDDPAFLAWLHRLHEAGDEIVQHGFTQRYVPQPTHGWRARLVGGYLCAGRAELLTTGYIEARQRFAAGRRMLRQAGFDAAGFVAPCWQLSRMAWRAVRDAGFHYVGTARGLVDLRREQRWPLPTACFTTTPPWLDGLLRLRARYLAQRRQRSPVLGVAIHPHDLHGSVPFTAVLRFLDAVAAGRDCLTYSGFLRQQATQPGSFRRL
ncbi:MAG: DUF2334 domain-containing protein [Candidatus Tectomicrobia bacterium]|nr:DUF2334 domain-containing protein [Candidatus Tectomicrobia bacterium]